MRWDAISLTVVVRAFDNPPGPDMGLPGTDRIESMRFGETTTPPIPTGRYRRATVSRSRTVSPISNRCTRCGSGLRARSSWLLDYRGRCRTSKPR